jgi:hypothetical protein
MRRQLLTFILLSFCFTSFGTTWHVNVNATGNNTGVNWANAFTNLQSGIAAAIVGDQIWVAQGVYKPTSSTSRSVSFNLNDGVTWYGGFNGTETLLSQRDVALNVTVLSGDVGVQGNDVDNTFHVVKAISVGSLTRIDGFKIVSGNTDADALVSYHGGGLYNENGSPTIANCTFQANDALNRGGAIAHITSGSIKIINCTVINNTAGSFGGGIYIGGGIALIQDCNISLNQAVSDAGGLYTTSGTTTVDRTVLSGNISGGLGGAAYIYTSICNFNNSLIAGNLAGGYGGLIYNSSSMSSIVNCTIAHNSSNGNPGSPDLRIDGATLSNSIIWGNAASDEIINVNDQPVNNCIVEGGYTCTCATNILSSNPLFVSPGNSGLAPFDASAYNYHVTLNSPAINAGNNNSLITNYELLDLDNLPRVYESLVDIGAYEKQEAIGIGELHDSSEWLVYPNPAHNTFTLSFNGQSSMVDGQLTIYDVMGRIVHQKILTSAHQQIENSFTPGIYFVRVQAGKKVFTEKLVVE